jgi:formate dehydrogenase subunit beta
MTADTRLGDLKQAVEAALSDLDGVLALRRTPDGDVAPYLFTDPAGLSDLVLEPRYPLPTTLRLIQAAYPQARLGIVLRGCEERGLVETAKHNQVDLANVRGIGLNCTAADAEFCRCAKPYVGVWVTDGVGERVPGVDDARMAAFLELSQQERLAFWQEEFSHCIKCYACRNACPQCFCEHCTLEEELWVEQGIVPPPFPSFHMVRALHTIAKCVGCRECELACPAKIPLTTLYSLLRRDVSEMFGYETGTDLEAMPPLLLTLSGAPIKSELV